MDGGLDLTGPQIRFEDDASDAHCGPMVNSRRWNFRLPAAGMPLGRSIDV
jgi:hypothetical protein